MTPLATALGATTAGWSIGSASAALGGDVATRDATDDARLTRSRITAVALVVVGSAVAAAGTHRGAFLRDDNHVAPPAFSQHRVTDIFGRPRIEPSTGHPRAAAALHAVELVAQVFTALVVLAVVVAVAVSLAAGLLALRRLRLQRLAQAIQLRAYDDAGTSNDDAEESLRRRVGASLEQLAADLDDVDVEPREAVIACYARMEQALADVGTRRAHSETPA